MTAEFKQQLVKLAKQSVDRVSRCTNEESTKMFLVLPVISLLGYDPSNPMEVMPEHAADFSEKYKNRVDYAILKNDTPVIAIECKCVGVPLKDERGQLRSYFNAAPSIKMGVLTDGLVWEFYAQTASDNMMDQDAFLTFDLRDVAKGKINESIIEGLKELSKLSFEPENIGAEAKRKLIYKLILGNIRQLATEPNDAFCRTVLKEAGVNFLRQSSLNEYREMVKLAFQEFIYDRIIHDRIVQGIDFPIKDSERPSISSLSANEQPAESIDAEEPAFLMTAVKDELRQWAIKRIAFLVSDDDSFSKIEDIHFKLYRDKMVVFYKKERVGRLFDFYEDEGGEPKHGFQFARDLDLAEKGFKTDTFQDIDSALLTAFNNRVASLG